MKPLTEQQKKWAWIIGAVLLVVHFAPSMLASLRGMTHPAPAVHSIPSPVRSVPVPKPAPPPLTPQQLQDAQMAKLAGVWTGGTVSDRGSCKVRLELQKKPEVPDLFSGYSTRVCGPSLAFLDQRPSALTMKRSVLNQMTPVSDILSGSSANGSITLNLDQSVAKSPDGCQMTSFTLTPFGQAQLAAKWTEDKCNGGQMVMVRAR
jgi:hypothetical protein